MKPALTLYLSYPSRAAMIEWYLQELGLQAELAVIDIRGKQQNRQPEFLKINPFGEVPVLKDGDFILAESGAIIQYLAEKYGGVTGLEERATLAKWVLVANAKVAAWAAKDFREWSGRSVVDEALTALDAILADKEYLEGSFSAADVPMGSYLMYMGVRYGKDINLAPYPNVIRYLKRLAKRPACAATHKDMVEGVAALEASEGRRGHMKWACEPSLGCSGWASY